MNAIFGAGGFAREVAWLMEDLTRNGDAAFDNYCFVVADGDPADGTAIHGRPVVSESTLFSRHREAAVAVFLAVGSPALRRRMHLQCLQKLPRAHFPPLIHPESSRDRRPGTVVIGEGAIVCAGVRLTTDIAVGEFVHLNLNTTVGHDARIGRYSTLSPGVNVSGRVRIGDCCFVGSGAALLEGVSVVDRTVIGAGATVIRDIAEAGTWVGVPARRVERP